MAAARTAKPAPKDDVTGQARRAADQTDTSKATDLPEGPGKDLAPPILPSSPAAPLATAEDPATNANAPRAGGEPTMTGDAVVQGTVPRAVDPLAQSVNAVDAQVGDFYAKRGIEHLGEGESAATPSVTMAPDAAPLDPAAARVTPAQQIDPLLGKDTSNTHGRTLNERTDGLIDVVGEDGKPVPAGDMFTAAPSPEAVYVLTAVRMYEERVLPRMRTPFRTLLYPAGAIVAKDVAARFTADIAALRSAH